MHRRTAALAALVVSLATSAPSSAAEREVVLARGDTLWSVARAHGCSIEALRREGPRCRAVGPSQADEG